MQKENSIVEVRKNMQFIRRALKLGKTKAIAQFKSRITVLIIIIKPHPSF
jgi:hypothetical protein